MLYLFSFILFLGVHHAFAGLPRLSQPARQGACALTLSKQDARQTVIPPGINGVEDQQNFFDGTTIYSGRAEIEDYFKRLETLAHDFENSQLPESKALIRSQTRFFVGFNVLSLFAIYSLANDLMTLPAQSAFFGVAAQSFLLGVTAPIRTNRRWFLREWNERRFRRDVEEHLASESGTNSETLEFTKTYRLDLNFIRTVISPVSRDREWIQGQYNLAAMNESSSAFLKFLLRLTVWGRNFETQHVLVDRKFLVNPFTKQPELIVRVRTSKEK